LGENVEGIILLVILTLSEAEGEESLYFSHSIYGARGQNTGILHGVQNDVFDDTAQA
jgi:hypothetical protein